jgi:hypothetical protein
MNLAAESISRRGVDVEILATWLKMGLDTDEVWARATKGRLPVVMYLEEFINPPEMMDRVKGML